MKNKIISLTYLLLVGVAGQLAAAPATPPPTVEEARQFIQEFDREYRRLTVAQSLADWDKQTNITPETEAKAAKAGEASLQYTTQAVQKSARFVPILQQLDPETRRQIELLRAGQTLVAPSDAKKAGELATLTARMDANYGKGKVCAKNGKDCKDLGALEDILSSSKDPKALEEAWEGWHDVMGRSVRNDYRRFVELGNEGARGVGFKDMGEQWRSAYDMSPEAFAQTVDKLWEQVQPLYEDLHCYTRQKLSAQYGSKMIGPRSPLPAHLTGNMWAQDWSYLYKQLEPYPGQAQIDVTPALQEQKYTPEKMVRLGESFFTSLGLKPLPATFWERSMFVKPEGKDVVCHASAWDPTYQGDVRIKMCIKVNQEDLITIHHELGHDYYFLYYYQLPMLFQNGANDGFHEAIGDAIALSMTPAYLQKVGLLATAADNPQATMNAQMQRALEKIAFLPFGLLVDKWRWDVFSGKVPPSEWNRHWWDLRLKYQGVAPSKPRPKDAFDPGAKYHIPGNTPYMRYFLAAVLQFQMHRELCKVAGHQGPLHTCSIYGSKEAGTKLEQLLKLGASKPWPEALAALTGQKDMDASAMLDYFAPLHTWLKEQNKGQSCGWDQRPIYAKKSH